MTGWRHWTLSLVKARLFDGDDADSDDDVTVYQAGQDVSANGPRAVWRLLWRQPVCIQPQHPDVYLRGDKGGSLSSISILRFFSARACVYVCVRVFVYVFVLLCVCVHWWMRCSVDERVCGWACACVRASALRARVCMCCLPNGGHWRNPSHTFPHNPATSEHNKVTFQTLQ